MFTRKDKRLSSARKRMMSQLGKRKTIEEQSTRNEQDTEIAATTTTPRQMSCCTHAVHAVHQINTANRFCI